MFLLCSCLSPRNGSYQNCFNSLPIDRSYYFSGGTVSTIDSEEKKISFHFRFQKNELILERIVCPPSSELSAITNSFHCVFKYISRRDLKIEFRLNATKPLDDVWVHSVFYHKFNGISFQKFPIDLLENVCNWISGKGKSYVMNWSLSKIIQYSNVNHACPWVDLHFKVDNISAKAFTFDESFLPSGQYRVDNDFTETESRTSTAFMSASLYFSVSDHRLEKV